MATAYEKLVALGHSPEEIKKAINVFPDRCRTFTVVGQETPDGYPLIGLSYFCDYRSEEEHGQRSLYKTLGINPGKWQMDAEKKNLITRFKGIPSLIILAEENDGPFGLEEQSWGLDIKDINGVMYSYGLEGKYNPKTQKTYNFRSHYDWNYRYLLGSVQEIPSEGPNSFNPTEWMKKDEIVAIAKKLGLTGKLPTRKDNLINFIQDSPEFAAKAQSPNTWPAWFHSGKALVMRADRGIVADLLNILFEASQEGALACGGGTGVFNRAATFYDARDVGPLLREQRLKTHATA